MNSCKFLHFDRTTVFVVPSSARNSKRDILYLALVKKLNIKAKNTHLFRLWPTNIGQNLSFSMTRLLAETKSLGPNRFAINRILFDFYRPYTHLNDSTNFMLNIIMHFTLTQHVFPLALCLKWRFFALFYHRMVYFRGLFLILPLFGPFFFHRFIA